MLEQYSTQVPKKVPQRFVKRLSNISSAVTGAVRKRPWVAVIAAVLIVAVVAGLIFFIQRDHKQATTPSDNPVVAEYQKQLPSLKASVDKSPNDTTARKNYAVALYATGDLNGAKTQYEKVVSLNSKDSVAWNNLGNTYRDLNKTSEAVNAYNKAIDSDPKAINSYVNLANLQLYTLNKSNDAIATYRKAQSALPDNQQITLLLALAYEQAGDKTDAKQTLQNLLAQHSDNVAAKANLDRINQE